MTTDLDTVLAQAMKLTLEERAELIEALAVTVVSDTPLHPDWATEIDRRVSAVEAGTAVALPAEQVMAELKDLVEAGRPRR